MDRGQPSTGRRVGLSFLATIRRARVPPIVVGRSATTPWKFCARPRATSSTERSGVRPHSTMIVATGSAGTEPGLESNAYGFHLVSRLLCPALWLAERNAETWNPRAKLVLLTLGAGQP